MGQSVRVSFVRAALPPQIKTGDRQADIHMRRPLPARSRVPEPVNEVNFFGVKIKVKSPTLASLLNSDVNDDLVVVARRAFRDGRREGGASGSAQPDEASSAGVPDDEAGTSAGAAERTSQLPPEWLDLRLDRDRAAWERDAALRHDAAEDPLAGLSAAPDPVAGEERGG
jgi:hypothetical protein